MFAIDLKGKLFRNSARCVTAHEVELYASTSNARNFLKGNSQFYKF